MAKKRKRLALLVGQADESFPTRFITGFTKQAFSCGKDVCIFSMYKKYQDTTDREMGESNIFSLFNPDFFDGVLILKDTIQTPGVAEDIERRLNESYTGPVLVVDITSKHYKSVYIDCYTPVLKLTDHLIEDHGVKDIAFLTGKKKHRHSIQRCKAFMESMRNHGLEVPKERIIEGDFWYLSGEQCIEDLLASGDKLPEALICANDQMAIGACKTFEEKGFKVPDDLIIVGCDSNEEGQTSPKILTSYIAPAFELGRYCVDALEDIKAGRKLCDFTAEAEIIYGETCGCDKMKDFGYNLRRDEWATEIYDDGFGSVNNLLFENLMIQNDLIDFVGTVYSYAYQIKGADSFDLCLSKDINDMTNRRLLRNEGYPDKMIHAVKYSRSHMEDKVGLDDLFDTSQMLPELMEYREEPRAYFFLPVFFEDTCFGYAAISYGNVPRCYDGIARNWIKAVSYGFENLRKNMIAAGLNDELSIAKTNKYDKYDDIYENFSLEEKEEYDLVKEIIAGNLFTYHFQPIVSAVDGHIYSYEALMRSMTRKKVSPLVILKYASMLDKFPEIESDTFNNVLDIITERKEEIGDAKIFINSIPGTKVDDLDVITRKLKANHEKVVVELTEESELGEADLNRLKEFFRSLDIEIAVDDYGTGYSNISNLLRYMPNYVKIDRSLLSEIQNKPQKQHFVREIIDFCHNNNVMALAEGVETAEELRTVILLGADLIQGFYTGRPKPEFVGRIDEKVINEIKLYQQERTDGKTKRVYVAGKTNRVSLLNLMKENVTDIIIGQGEMVYHDIAIIGMPSLKTDMHLRIEPEYSGRITLENVCFSNIKNRPCIELGEKSDVNILLKGYNTLCNTGIMVPESAELTIEGAGNLSIQLANQEFYGIGNDGSSKHGGLHFLASGNVSITANGTSGTFIGSGLGGSIEIKGGSFNLDGNSTDTVVVGAMYADSHVSVTKCGMELDISGTRVVGVGSLEKNATVNISDCSLKGIINGREVAGVGSLKGEKASVKEYNSMVNMSINADSCTAMGSLEGESNLDINIASFRVENVGEYAVAFGGMTDNTVANFIGVDTRIKVHNTIGRETYAKDENITIVNGRCKILVNDEEIERDIVFKF